MQPETIRDIALNLFSEAIGIIVTVFVIDRILASRLEKRWVPARTSIAKQFTRTYISALNSAYQTVAPLVLPANGMRLSPGQRCGEALIGFTRQLARFHRIVDLNNVAMDAEMAAQISQFLDHADVLEQRLGFLSKLYLKEYAQFSFVCDSPMENVREMERSAAYFKECYPTHWTDTRLVSNPTIALTEIEAAYRATESASNRLCFHPESYLHSPGNSLFTPDTGTLRRISSKTLSDGTKVLVDNMSA